MEMLRVRIGEAGQHADVREVQEVLEHLRKVLVTLCNELAEQSVRPRFEVVEAATGSLTLGVAPAAATETPPQLLPQFAKDLAELTQMRFRPTMSSELLSDYRALLKSPNLDAPVSYGYGDLWVRIDAAVRQQFEEAVMRTTAYEVALMGTIESISIHNKPYRCSLYTKLPPRQRVRCTFAEPLLPAVADALRQKRLVEVKGNAVYGPVGIYPLQLHIIEAPEPVEPNLDYLRQAVHSMDIVPDGMSIVEYVDQLRQADEASA
jgi:hypothetical protein